MRRSQASQELSFTLTLSTSDLMYRVNLGELPPQEVVEHLRTLEEAFAPGTPVLVRLETVKTFLEHILPAPASTPSERFH